MESQITLEGIRELRGRLLAALDDLEGVEQKLQVAEHMVTKAGKVVEMTRPREEAEPAPKTTAAPQHAERILLRTLMQASTIKRSRPVCDLESIRRLIV